MRINGVIGKTVSRKSIYVQVMRDQAGNTHAEASAYLRGEKVIGHGKAIRQNGDRDDSRIGRIDRKAHV